jgi:hypothetical protein
MKFKHYILTFLFLLPVFYIFPQASVTINEYGVYFINEGQLTRLPIEQHITGTLFWRNYLIFSGQDANFAIIYNIENGVISDVLYPGPALGGLFPVESKNENLSFYVYGNEYELDPVTLSIINIITLTKNNDRSFDDRANDYNHITPHTEWEYIRKNHHRFTGKNYYINVILTNNSTGLYIIAIHGGEINRFVLITDYRNYIGR